MGCHSLSMSLQPQQSPAALEHPKRISPRPSFTHGAGPKPAAMGGTCSQILPMPEPAGREKVFLMFYQNLPCWNLRPFSLTRKGLHADPLAFYPRRMEQTGGASP